MQSAVGKIFESIGANPTPLSDCKSLRNLTAGLLVVVPAIFLSGLVMFIGARHLPREMALMLVRLKSTKVDTPKS